ncbi:MAG TPA: protein translocase subunit SecD [Acidobacteria bacterium]|nr:protein translocase subunit SecD [Acidobacteriota bacterium]
MAKNLRWKVLLIIGVVGLAVFAVYPPAEQIRLGLDLRGGAHLVMQVQTDDALLVETETSAEALSEQAIVDGIVLTSVTAVSPTEIRVEGVPPERVRDFQDIADELLGALYDREVEAGGAYTYRMLPGRERVLREESVRQALQTIERRVNELGVAEPIVAPYGGADRGLRDQILIQLPGVADVEGAKEVIGSTGLLEIKLVEDGPAPSREMLLQTRSGVLPPDLEVVPSMNASLGSTDYYLVRGLAGVTGRDLRTAGPTIDEYNQPAISFSFNREGARKFGDFTGANVGRSLAVIMDDRIESVATIQERISAEGRITGSFTQQEASDLALILRSGALPASLVLQEERTVGPTLGADSVRAGVIASAAGLFSVALFMLVYYRLSGINAVVAVALNLLIMLACMAYVGAVLTLPGIAGFILTIGMGVDSNVLIFERIKEEMGAARGVRAAVSAGFDRVFLTIIDTHIASLIAAAFLFQFGSGPIKGFATTLFFGLISNVFTAVFVSRTMFEAILTRRREATLSI